jgi:hypothetical protein
MLAIRLDLALEAISTVDAVSALRALLSRWSGAAEQAAIHFGLWQLTGTTEDGRRAAAAYRRLHERSPRDDYRQRYRQLTGQDLPPPAMPELPEVVTRYALEPNALLAQIERMPTLASS